MSSKRSKQRPRKKKKKQKQTKFMSLNNHFVPPPSDQYAAAAEAEENDPQVACLLEDSNQPGCMPTITDLFAPSAASSSSVVMDEFPSPASPSVEWDGGDGLARRALKGRERWVFCRDVEIHHHQQQTGLLQLKLDYDEVMTAWSGRAPPYIDGDGPQVVPELQQHHSIMVEVGSGGGWRVPEIKEEGETMKREERVERYRAKRQSRLFSKRIRYQVRKLNAEKRPRIKGRFVRRVDDM